MDSQRQTPLRKRTAVLRSLRDNGVLLVIITVLTVVTGVILSEAQAKIGWWPLVGAVVVVLLVLLTVSVVVATPIQADVVSRLANMERLVERAIEPRAITWLFETEQLAAYERVCDAPEVWLLTSDLLDDVQGGMFQEVVAQNLKRGIRQVYFVPNSPEVRARVETVLTYHKRHPNMRFVYVSGDLFLLSPKLDIVIYNPLAVPPAARRGFMGLPAPRSVRHYHAEIDGEFIDRLVGRLLPMLESGGRLA